MSLYPFFGPTHFSPFGEMMRDMRRMEQQYIPMTQNFNEPANNSEVVNTDEKFAVNLNVSRFKPEELKINLDGRKLSIQGVQELTNEHGFSKKSFSRVILLPEDVDISSIASHLSKDGKLSIEAPKMMPSQKRSIPIQQALIEQQDSDSE